MSINGVWDENCGLILLMFLINIVILRLIYVINRTADRPCEGAKGESFHDFYKDNKKTKNNKQNHT